MFADHLPDVLHRIDQSGGRFVVHQGDHLDFGMLFQGLLHVAHFRRLAPFVIKGEPVEPVRLRHGGDTVPIHAVADHQHGFSLAQAGAHRHLKSGGSGAGDQHCVEIRSYPENAHQFAADRPQKIRKLRFPVAQVRLQQSLAHPLRHIDRARIEQDCSSHKISRIKPQKFATTIPPRPIPAKTICHKERQTAGGNLV